MPLPSCPAELSIRPKSIRCRGSWGMPMRPGTKLTIREIEKSDCAAAGECFETAIRWSWDKYLRDSYPEEAIKYDIERLSGRRLEERVTNPDRLAFVAVAGGKVVGAVVGDVHGMSGVAKLDWLVVDPDRHHEGIGMSLMEACEAYLRKRRVHKITINTLPALTPAIRLYMKFGLLPEALLRKAWWGADFLVMSKWIGEDAKR